MAEDISELIVKVTSDGIRQTSADLRALTKAADGAEGSVKKLGTSVATGSVAVRDSTATAKAFEDSMNKMAKATENVAGQLARLADNQTSAKQATAATTEEVKKGTDAVEKHSKAHGSNAASIRETMVLLHELSQGSFKRFGGSLMVLANQQNVIPYIIKNIGVAGLGMAVVLGGAFAAISLMLISGAAELGKFQRSMTLTGNMAGLTRDSVHEMGNSLANDVTGGSHHATLMLEELAATGKFTGETLESVGRAALNFEHLTGESGEKVVKVFDGMEQGVAKWALKANESYHFLTYAQYEHIKVLEQQGEKQEAMRVAADAMANAMDDHGRKVGAVVQWYREWGISIDKIKTWFASVGAGDTPFQEYSKQGAKVLAIQKTLAEETAKLKNADFVDKPAQQKQVDFWTQRFTEENNIRLNLQRKFNADKTKAEQDSEKASIQADAIAADQQAEVEQRRNRTRQEKMLDDIATEKNVRTRQNAGLLQTQLAAQGLSYSTLIADAKEKDKAANEVLRQSGAVRINALSNEFDAQMELRRKYGLNVKSNEDQLQTAVDAARDRWKEKKTPGADDSAARRDAALAEVRAGLQEDLQAHREFQRNSKELATKQGEDERTQLALRIADREAYLVKVKAAHDKEVAIVNNHGAGKTAVWLAENAKRGIKVEKDFTMDKNGVENEGKDDERGVVSREIAEREKLTKEITHAGEAENKRLDAAIKAEYERVAAIGQLKSVAMDFRSKEEQGEVAKAAAQADEMAAMIRIGEKYGYMSDLEVDAAKLDLGYLTDKIKKHEELGAAYKKAADEHRKVEAQERGTKNIDDMLAAAKRMEKGLVSVFGNVGKAIGGMGVAFGQMQKDMDTAQVKRSKAAADGISQSQAEATLADETMTAQLNGYANMAEASKNFFDSKSRGYAIADGIAKGFHAAEMVRSGISMAKSLAAGTAKMFEQLGAYAWPAIAAMGATMAAFGYSVATSSNGGGKSAAEVQKAQGTGSVFGDIGTKNDDGTTTYKDKSDSINKSLEDLKKNSNVMLPVNQAMLSSLRAIQASMSGLTNLVARTSGLTTGDNMGIQTGTLSRSGTSSGLAGLAGGAAASGMFGMAIGGIGTALLGAATFGIGALAGVVLNKLVSLWGSTKQEVKDSGLQFGGKVSSLQDGSGFSQYASVDTTKSSWFGLSKSTTNSVQTQGLSAEMSQQFGLIFSNLEDTMKLAAGSLGKNSADVGSAIENMVLETSVVSLKGLTGTELQNALNGVISKAMDEIAQKAFPAMDDFRQVGEGYAETVIRVASGIETAKGALEQLGIKAIDYTAIGNKQGDVATEMVKQSIAASEGLSGVNDMLQGMDGTMQELVDTYKSLDAIRKQMNGVGLNGKGLNVNVVKGAGGVSQLGSSLSTYQDKFFTDGEKSAIMLKSLTTEFDKLGVKLPASKAALRTLIEATGVSTDATATLTGQLLNLSGAYSDVVDANNTANKTATDNLNTSIDALKKFSDTIKAFKDGLLLGDLSTLTPTEKYIEAKRQYESTVAKAMTGDTTAQDNVTGSAQAYLEASRVVNASNADYSASFAQVQADMDKLQDYTGTQLTDAEKQLEVLNQQADSLTTLNTTAEGIKASIDSLVAPPPTPATVQSNADLIAEIAKLRDEQAAQADASAKQISDLTAAVYDAQDKAAKAIVEANEVAKLDQGWFGRSSQVLTER